MEGFRTLVERVGLDLSREELDRLQPLFERYLERLQALHAVDLSREEVAVVFPEAAPGPGGVE